MTDYPSMTAAQIAEAVRNRTVSAVEITKAALECAKMIGCELNAFITICEEKALAQAEAIDRRVATGDTIAGKNAKEAQPPLAGVPVAVKDNICYAHYPTTCGSRMLDHFVPPYTATAVQRLIDAGAVIIGKTNMDEFAMGSSNETSSFGPVLNPIDRALVPGGSSGGSAAAVAAGIVPVALGSDTGGSVRQPSAFCGVTGLRPTYGAVSRYGLTAFASSCDTIGPIARNAEDLALVQSVIEGHDPADATSLNIGARAFVGRSGLPMPERAYTIGIPREYFGDGLDPEIHAWVKRSLHDLQEIGHRIAEVSLPLTDRAIAAYYIIADAEASSNLARYDGVRYGLRDEGDGSLENMYAATRAAGFGREVQRRIILGTHVLSAGYYEEHYLQACRVRELMRREFDEVFGDVDLLITPTTPTGAFRLGERIEDPLAMYLSDVYTVAASLGGIPAISVPFGKTSDGRPVGVQFMADRGDELLLLQMAATLEALL